MMPGSTSAWRPSGATSSAWPSNGGGSTYPQPHPEPIERAIVFWLTRPGIALGAFLYAALGYGLRAALLLRQVQRLPHGGSRIRDRIMEIDPQYVQRRGLDMRRAIPALLAALVVGSIAVWGSVRAEPSCAAVPCTYIPLMRAELFPTVLPTAPPTPRPTVRPTSVYVTSYGLDTTYGLYLIGEVENASGKTVYQITITARFYDASGGLVTTAQGASILNRLDPGQRSPFVMFGGYMSRPIVRTELTLAWRSTSAQRYTPLPIVSHELRELPQGVQVVGQVGNNHAEVVNDIRVVVTFYLPDGTIYVGIAKSADSYTLAPGGASTYLIDTGHTDVASLPYTVQAEGYFSP